MARMRVRINREEVWRNRTVENIRKHVDEIGALTARKLKTYMTRGHKDLVKELVDGFYNDYIPKKYARTGSLYKAFQLEIHVNGSSFSYEFSGGGQNIKRRHRLNNNALYNLTMVEGWHGGAKSISAKKQNRWLEYWRSEQGKGVWNKMGGGNAEDNSSFEPEKIVLHPHPGTAYWRTPTSDLSLGDGYVLNKYSMWYPTQATRYSMNIDEEYQKRMEEFIANDVQEELFQILIKLFTRYASKMSH